MQWSGIQLKHRNIGPFAVRLSIPASTLTAAGIIALAILIRVVLLAQGWPHTNIDEGTMGEMAMNIAFRGAHPVFYYGQDYMGALQAYLAAPLFRLFGVSLFTLRLGLVFLYALFLVGMYLLSRLLYSRGLALFSIFLLALGSNAIMYRQLQAVGGELETLLFGSLALLLASWLALTSPASLSAYKEMPGLQRRRLLAYCGWGLVVGLGIWSHLLVLPCVLMSGLLLLLFCWRDMRTLAPLCLLLFLIVGLLPVILYNLHASPGHNTLSAVYGVYFEGQHIPLSRVLPKSLKSTLLVSLPTATSFPVCDLSATLYFGGSGPGAVRCAVTQGIWSLGILALWLWAALAALWTIWTRWYRILAANRTPEQREAFIRACARLAILGSVGIALTLFALSVASIYSSFLNARYLIALLIGTPTLLWPLWNVATTSSSDRPSVIENPGRPPARGGPTIRESPARIASEGADSSIVGPPLAGGLGMMGSTVSRFVSQLVLTCITIVFLAATVAVFADIPNAQASNGQQDDLVHHLLAIHATHIYSDFWSCDRIVFQSQQRIACSILTEQLQHQDARYQPNDTIVQPDPLASYVFPLNTPQATTSAQLFAHTHRPYHRYIFDNYVIYQPTG